MNHRLQAYRTKRDFRATPEPAGAEGAAPAGTLAFVIQKHAARALHYDFRLELDGTLKSWAVPKGPSLDPGVKRMAVHVEDHPLSYAAFEGVIPPGQYGAGTVIVWDRGTWVPVGDPHRGYAQGKLKFGLQGEKLRGAWTLVRMQGRAGERQEPWLLIKERDDEARPLQDYDVVEALPESVLRPSAAPAKTLPPAGIASAATAPSITREAPLAPPKETPAMNALSSTATARRAGGDRVAGVRITHGDRVIDPASGLTKLALARYYERVAEAMLPHLRERPVSLVRAPDGIGGELFFQKHAGGKGIPGITRLDPSFDPDHDPLMAISSLEALIGAVQMNTIEFHTWNATTRHIDQPDRMTFDLDPGEGVPWRQIVEGAELTRTLLDELGLASWLKTSGGKGLHVVVPLRPKDDWETVKDFSKAVVEHLAETIPARFVAKSGPANRVGRIFVDYLRNGRGATTVAAFSARARPGLGVSVPLRWQDLDRLTASNAWTIESLPPPPPHPGPWQGYADAQQDLAGAMERLGHQPPAASQTKTR